MRDPVDLLPSNRTIVGRLVRLPLRLLPRGASLPVIAGPNAGLKWIIGSGPHSCWLGINEISKRRLFNQVVTRGSIVFDIGANVGSYTLQASRLCGPEGRVVAFEPSPDNLAYLARHIDINRLENVTVIAAALTDSDGHARFHATADRVTSHLAMHGSIVVRCHRLDTLVERGTVPQPDIIKIDVEGAEAAVLRGALHVLRTARPVIFLATHGSMARGECEEILSTAGYTMEPIDGLDDEFVARGVR
jgi:FkbM family methyltransferase